MVKTIKTPVLSKKEKIAKMKAKLAILEGDKREIKSDKIAQDEYISVMSLLPYTLNLSTRTGGQGSTKKFTRFGEVKRILYGDLVNILEVHQNFMQAGYFYILDPRFIQQHGLDDIYSTILTKETIEEILAANTEECVGLYKSAGEKQKDVIIQLLVAKIADNPKSVNLNIIDHIARVSGVDILDRAENLIKPERESETK